MQIILSFLNLKFKQGVFFNQKNEWNQDVKSNFENIEFWVGPISKLALVRIIVHQLKNLNLKIPMVFQKKEDEPLTYIPPVVKHSFLDVFAFDNGSQGASM